MFCQPSSGSHLNILAQHHVRTDLNVRAQGGTRPNAGGGIDTGWKLSWWKQGADDADECLIRIANHDSGPGATRARGELFRYENGPRMRGDQIGGIPAGNRKGESIRAGPAQRSDRLDTHITVAKQAATDKVGDRLRGKAASRHATSCPL